MSPSGLQIERLKGFITLCKIDPTQSDWMENIFEYPLNYTLINKLFHLPVFLVGNGQVHQVEPKLKGLWTFTLLEEKYPVCKFFLKGSFFLFF